MMLLLKVAIFLYFGRGNVLSDPDINFGKYAVNTESAFASRIGLNILKKGGNAVDAAIASAIAVGVVNSYSSGIGGGGVMLLRLPKLKDYVMVDFKETSPRNIKFSMFEKRPETSKKGALSVCTPGEVKGLYEAHKRYGKLKWVELFKENIKLCNEGFIADKFLIKKLRKNEKDILEDKGLRETYTKDGSLIKEGDLVKRPNLGNTLKVISTNPQSFYKGDLSKKISSFIKAKGGIMDEVDLADYKYVERSVIKGKFREYDVYTTNLPSSGLFLINALKVFSYFNLRELRRLQLSNDISSLYHIFIEISKFMFSERGEFADPDFLPNWKQKVSEIISEKRAKEIYKKINLTKVLNKSDYNVGCGYNQDNGTTHINVIDNDNMVVSITSSVNTEFGSKLLDPVTGILFNNTIDDFYIPGIFNSYSLEPSLLNLLTPIKRPFSSMAPILFENQNEIIAIGAAGGTRIPTSIFLTFIYHYLGKNLKESLSSYRIHNQIFPGKTFVETNFPKSLAKELTCLGHKIEYTDIISSFTSVQLLHAYLEKNKLKTIFVASDKRKGGVSCGV